MTLDLRSIISLLIGVKLAFFLVVLVAYSTFPFGDSFYSVNFIHSPNETVSISTAFKTWDAQHYLYLADHWYSPNIASNAFFPLYPALMAAVSMLTGDGFISGLIISNVLSVGVVILFYRIGREFLSEKTAFRSVLLFLSFPTAFYLNLIYTESLFLFLVLAYFYFLLVRRSYLLAALVSFLLPLAKAVGLFVGLLQALQVFWDKAGVRRVSLPTFNKPLVLNFNYRILFAIVPMLGFVGYLLIMKVSTGEYLAGFTAQNAFVGQYNVINILYPVQFFRELFNVSAIHSFRDSLLDRTFFLFYLLCLPLIWRYTPRIFFFFALIGLTPFFGSFMAYTRYVFLVFPLFYALSAFFATKRGALLFYPYLSLSMALQILFTIMHTLNYWVS